ncbi:type III restriction enzyme, res subunit [Caldicellulosiruptor saccharolyticus DSM 8903]|uniref:Type III restriction enzyme, res subunit n=1 Tax=Caldicellulosiruptor saccharolyticus (strain ATCC 43494 / DSM 8903 / Tp8T 6331) TaxID=351627 RepID=A4XFJ4_CALS8|nr:DEAD/DEAH box helicase family protein [Caldicellulosiruptor saccharolyticus]ABP65679.1 type III restriction enzyme, res subunit [Caldicellulosiruptor saccharolyticus DSM 8903]
MNSERLKAIQEHLTKISIEDVAEIYKDLENIYNQLLSKHGIDIQKCFCGANENFLEELKKAFSKAVEINMIVSFLLESGVRLIIEDLIEAKKRNCPIRIVTGRYLNITQPSALYLIKDRLGSYVDLRFFKDDNIPFHPKAYIIEYEGGKGDIFIGSSNLSESALTYGIEWNYRIEKTTNPKDYEQFKKEFFKILKSCTEKIDDELLRKYSRSWKRPKIFIEIKEIQAEVENTDNSAEDIDSTSSKDISMVAEEVLEYDKSTFAEKDDTEQSKTQHKKPNSRKIVPLYPREAQTEALYWLKKCREEGLDRALVVAATGIGKTFLAAFDSIGFKTVLFVAHREEILRQAALSFKTIRSNATIGFFTGDRKETEKDIIFASVQTLGKEEYLNPTYFSSDYFEYIIIDEFHHAVAKSYQNIINYFKPKFLLGLTATPERLDNKDVFELCNYNVVYELRLKDAINKGYLVPFHYYGIYDETDFSQIPEINGKYKEDELEKVLMIHKRADLILKNYLKFNKQKTLAFCCSRNHAEFMADYFNKNGVKCCAVYSGEQGKNALQRSEAIRKLKNGQIKVIFTVDMFNEGVDIPEIDMVMFLRPTESPTVFLQQLGRGLRKAKNKNYLTVLDFIGNYKRANLIPFLLSTGEYDIEKIQKSKYSVDDFEYPDGCVVDFDFRIIDIFKKQAESLKNIQEIVYEEFLRIKEMLGKRPSRVEFFKYIDTAIYASMKKYSDPFINVFKDYISFLKINNQLEEGEESLFNTFAHKFIKVVENTMMTKIYKMPLLLAFYNNGNIKLKVGPDDIYEAFKEFFSNPSNAIDLEVHKSTRNYKDWQKEEYIKLSRNNPEKYLISSHPEFFYWDGDYFCINDKLADFINNEYFLVHFKDAIDFRIKRYYRERYEKWTQQ